MCSKISNMIGLTVSRPEKHEKESKGRTLWVFYSYESFQTIWLTCESFYNIMNKVDLLHFFGFLPKCEPLIFCALRRKNSDVSVDGRTLQSLHRKHSYLTRGQGV